MEGSIRPKPRFADRISKRVVIVVVAVLFGAFAIFMSALDQMDKRKQKPADSSASVKPSSSTTNSGGTVVPKELTDAPGADGAASASSGRSSLVAANAGASAPDSLGLDKGGSPSLTGGANGVPSLSGASDPARGAASGAGGRGEGARGGLPAGAGGLPNSGTGLPADNSLGRGSMSVEGSGAVNAPPTAEEQEARAAKVDRARRMSQARSGGLSAKAFETDDKKAGAPAVSSTAAASLLATLQGQANAATSAAPLGQSGQHTDSEQDEKLSFVKTAGKSDQSYLQASTLPAVSKNELQRGSYLPLRLEGAINSDQPGMVKARVTEDVYDTVSGCRLLVPAMTIVEGTYDSKVALGQSRNLVVWNYMGFEDGSHLDIGAMQGYDSSGAAGLAADVDNHYFKLFGLAFGMSLVTAGVQASQPPVPTGTTAQTPEQSLATALAQQYGQLGAQILGKQMQVQPTLKNYPGERFMIMLPLSIAFKKAWRTRC